MVESGDAGWTSGEEAGPATLALMTIPEEIVAAGGRVVAAEGISHFWPTMSAVVLAEIVYVSADMRGAFVATPEEASDLSDDITQLDEDGKRRVYRRLDGWWAAWLLRMHQDSPYRSSLIAWINAHHPGKLGHVMSCILPANYGPPKPVAAPSFFLGAERLNWPRRGQYQARQQAERVLPATPNPRGDCIDENLCLFDGILAGGHR